MVLLVIEENPLINLKKAEFHFTDEWLNLTDEDREELAEWIKFVILSYFGAKRYKWIEENYGISGTTH